MRKKDKKTLVITTLICVCALTAYGIFYKFYPLPESRRENLQTFWVLATAILVNIILNIGLNFTVCKKMGAKFLVGMGKWIVPFTSIFATIIFIYSMMYPQSSLIENATYTFVGLIFIVSGNYFPKNHVNPYIGLNFPWLLDYEKSWDKTHKLASYTWLLAGILLIIQLFISLLKIVSIPLVIILVGILPLVYSLMLVYKKRR